MSRMPPSLFLDSFEVRKQEMFWLIFQTFANTFGKSSVFGYAHPGKAPKPFANTWKVGEYIQNVVKLVFGQFWSAETKNFYD